MRTYDGHRNRRVHVLTVVSDPLTEIVLRYRNTKVLFSETETNGFKYNSNVHKHSNAKEKGLDQYIITGMQHGT